MYIRVDRFISDHDTTVSRVLVNERHVCFGLEDEYREHKVAGETRIPAGIYDIRLRKTGGFHNRYSKRFPTFHRGMLQVMNVPDYEYVLIHCGNTDEDTSGCLLLGNGAYTGPGNMSLLSSANAYAQFYPLVYDAALTNRLTITFMDNDR